MLSLALTTSGCGPGKAVVADWTGPVVVDTALRCPQADERARAEFRRVTPPLVADTRGADGKPAVSLDAVKDKIDEFRGSEARKNATGLRVLDEHARCVSGGAADSRPAKAPGDRGAVNATS